MMESNNYLGLLIRKDVADIQSVGNSLGFLVHSIKGNNYHYLEKELYDLTAKYKKNIEQVEAVARNTDPWSEKDYNLGNALYFLEINKKKYFKELSAMLMKTTNSFRDDALEIEKGEANLDWIYSSYGLKSVFKLLAEDFNKQNRSILTGIDKSWVERQVDLYLHNIQKWQSPFSDERLSTNEISYIKAIFGMLYAFTRDLETMMLQKDLSYNLYQEASFSLSSKDAKTFGDMLSDGDKPPITFEKKPITAVPALPPAKKFNVDEVVVSEEEIKEAEEQKLKVEAKQKEFLKANRITDDVVKVLEEAEMHSYQWFKKQLVMIVSSYISLDTNVTIEKYNPIFEAYVKALASSFKAPIPEVSKIEAGFHYLAEFAEEARKCMMKDNNAEVSKEEK